MQSRAFGGLHVALIMDGNGRWARRRGLPRAAGHRAGAHAVRRVVEAAPGLGIGTLTLYAFSCDNWGRPAREVSALMELLERFLVAERERCRESGVRINVIGRRDRLPATLLGAIRETEAVTRAARRLHLRLAVDYSARWAIAATAAAPPVGDFAARLNRVLHSRPAAPDVDLLIRTSGEQRLSDFLLWECAYAELCFTRCLWPDFGAGDLARALAEFHGRERRFGRLPGAAAREIIAGGAGAAR